MTETGLVGAPDPRRERESSTKSALRLNRRGIETKGRGPTHPTVQDCAPCSALWLQVGRTSRTFHKMHALGTMRHIKQIKTKPEKDVFTAVRRPASCSVVLVLLRGRTDRTN